MFDRFKQIIEEENFNKLKNTKILIVGIGGVGGYALESLARSGVVNIAIVDGDIIEETNLNRQIIALKSNIGISKVEAAKKRMHDINPNINLTAINEFIDQKNINKLFSNNYDYIIDACDTVTTKILLIKYAIERNIKIISCMGTGNRTDSTKITITRLDKTINDPLAKIMRKLLKEHNLTTKIPVIWSSELPIKTNNRIPGSCITVPMSAGAALASYIINDIINEK